MAIEKRAGKDISREELNRIELAVFEEVLRSAARMIDALLIDGIPYTKMLLPPSEVV